MRTPPLLGLQTPSTSLDAEEVRQVVLETLDR